MYPQNYPTSVDGMFSSKQGTTARGTNGGHIIVVEYDTAVS